MSTEVFTWYAACTTCKGEGTILRTDAGIGGVGGFISFDVTCPDCNGTGRGDEMTQVVEVEDNAGEWGEG